jgi:L-threonylcarbamoyladenylate synthase
MYVSVEQAVQALKNHEVVAIPTETVYGLAGRYNSEQAVQKIFEVKRRPFFDPLIVHVSSLSQVPQLAKEWSSVAQALAERFWPGPLTLVVPKTKEVSDLITSGLPSVGLRWPRHKIAEKLIEATGPLAAPSANLFGKTSPSNASHVETEFQSAVKIIDGGPCEVGIESTVVKVDGNQINFLRKGSITPAQIEKHLQNLKIDYFVAHEIARQFSPGEMNHHYMPAQPLVYVGANQIQNWKEALISRLGKSIEIDSHFNVSIDT